MDNIKTEQQRTENETRTSCQSAIIREVIEIRIKAKGEDVIVREFWTREERVMIAILREFPHLEETVRQLLEHPLPPVEFVERLTEKAL